MGQPVFITRMVKVAALLLLVVDKIGGERTSHRVDFDEVIPPHRKPESGFLSPRSGLSGQVLLDMAWAEESNADDGAVSLMQTSASIQKGQRAFSVRYDGETEVY